MKFVQEVKLNQKCYIKEAQHFSYATVSFIYDRYSQKGSSHMKSKSQRAACFIAPLSNTVTQTLKYPHAAKDIVCHFR